MRRGRRQRGGKEGEKSTQKLETGGEGWPRAPEEVGAGPGEGSVEVGPGPARTVAAPGAGWGQRDRTGCPRVPGSC